MTDRDTQLEYACVHLFPNEPMSIADIDMHLSDAEGFDYVLYSSPDGIEEFIIVAGAEHYHLEYRMGTWIGPHNSTIRWREHPDCETATEVADTFAEGGWSVLSVDDNNDQEEDDGD